MRLSTASPSWSRTCCPVIVDSSIHVLASHVIMYQSKMFPSSLYDSGRTWYKAEVGISGHFNALCDCAKHDIQYRTLSRPFVDSELTSVGEELVIDDTPTSFTAEILTPSPQYDCRGEVVLDDPILSTVRQ